MTSRFLMSTIPQLGQLLGICDFHGSTGEADQRNSTKNKSKNYMKSEDKWDFLENILQTFVQTQKLVKKAAIAVVVTAHVADTAKQTLN